MTGPSFFLRTWAIKAIRQGLRPTIFERGGEPLSVEEEAFYADLSERIGTLSNEQLLTILRETVHEGEVAPA